MKKKPLWQQTQGSVVVITALSIVLALGSLALGVDLLHLYLVKSELQRAADAGALAAAKALLNTGGTSMVVNVRPDCARAVSTAQAVVASNPADGTGLQLLAKDVTFGRWDTASQVFTPTGCGVPGQVEAVQVVVRKDEEANGSVSLYFASFLANGWGSAGLTGTAVALAGYGGSVPAGGGVFPLAVDLNKVPPDHSGEPVRLDFNPTTTDNACWHTFDDNSPGAKDLKNLVNGTTPSPALKVGDAIRVTEGTDDAVFQELARTFNRKTAAGESWDVLVPVISGDSHTGWTEVLGFVAFRLTAVEASGGDKYLEGVTVPNSYYPNISPGGPNYGLWAGLPKLVQ